MSNRVDSPARIRVLINPKSGTGRTVGSIMSAVEQAWAGTGADIHYQVSNSVADGQAKARRAVAEGVGTLLVAGGDGMINTIGAELIGTGAALGVLPCGCGIGFARHFGIPLQPARAAAALRRARPTDIDVGFANGRPFFVTCGMAADASLVRHFEKSPVRGILPYVLAATYELFEYPSQQFRVVLDGREELRLDEVLVFTVANLTQFGGGALIAPSACADDGLLEMVVVRRQAAAKLMQAVPRLFNGTLDRTPGVTVRRFTALDVHRPKPGVIQVDGEALEADALVSVRTRRKALRVLVPDKQGVVD